MYFTGQKKKLCPLTGVIRKDWKDVSSLSESVLNKDRTVSHLQSISHALSIPIVPLRWAATLPGHPSPEDANLQ